jgi:predicted DNA-binding transcriptional regulator AlpA
MAALFFLSFVIDLYVVCMYIPHTKGSGGQSQNAQDCQIVNRVSSYERNLPVCQYGLGFRHPSPQKNEVMEKLLTAAEVAIVLGIKPDTLRVWRSRGQGPRVYRVGRLCRYRERDIQEFYERNQREEN